ncbi:hypothetical protein BKA67DRAFT_140536 [Truncatella angustata]|uniref:Uncharacterized protein n=1 Tax=Truncatella angustata TaxID=152316 RepID=A0A9P8REN6_9PEZI|nr:uncharacterized protein BKA67DRAFT_140536 [Truncatella angustata]KAH6640068.1 hypothetical protein BKA67DRAFT_140536 [Truncatella angustata]
MSEVRTDEPMAPARATAPSPSRTPQPATQAQQSAVLGSTAHPQQPVYSQYPYAPPQFVQQSRVIPYDKTWHLIKLVLRAASLVCCVVLLGISIAISIGPGYDGWNITIYWVAPLVAVAGIWDLAELITILACGKRNGAQHRRGIHPGAHVGVELCIWLAGVFCVFVSVMAYYSAVSQLRNCQEEQEDGRSSSSSSYYSYYCDEDEWAILSKGTVVPILRAIEAFIALLTLVHFILFVYACIETNQRNRSRSQYMMMPPQMYYGPQPGMAPYGYPTMPPQAYMAAPQGASSNEKSTAAIPQPQGNHSNFAGFYAPAGATPAYPPQPQATPKEPIAASSSA